MISRVSLDSPQSIDTLNRMFRVGTARPIKGRFQGSLLAPNLGPSANQVLNALLGLYLPWQGKMVIDGAGWNVFDRSALPLARLFWPTYRGDEPDTHSTFRAFEFRTWLGHGLMDPDRSVLKIDYRVTGNPGLTVQRILDELVEVAPDDYLGKAHVQWWWGGWQTVAFFRLRPDHQTVPDPSPLARRAIARDRAAFDQSPQQSDDWLSRIQ